MIEIPLAAVLSVVGVILAAIVGGGFTLLIQRRKQPAEDAPSVIALSNQLISLALLHAKTIADQAQNNVSRTLLDGKKDETIASLIADRDGLPVRVAELTARSLLDAGYMEALQKMLEKSGIAREDQPVKPVQEPLTPLNPVDLLNKLAQEKAIREGDTQVVTVTTPAEIRVVEKPQDDNTQGVPK